MSRARNRMARRTSAGGFSLIELMISLALFGLIASGALGLVMSGARSQAHSARVDVAQSGLRAGLDFMTRDILSAGTGCKNSLVLGKTGATLQVITWSDNTGPNSSDSLDIYTIDGTVQSTSGALAGLPVTLSAAAANGASSFTVSDATPFKAGDMVELTDLSNGILLKIATASGTTLTTAGANTLPSAMSATGTTVFLKSRHVTYSIAATEFGAATLVSGNGSALMMDLWDGAGGTSNPQPLAEGVEDLQVALAIDTNADGVIAPEAPGVLNGDEWIGNVFGEAAPASLVNLKAVRITLVAKSTIAERGSFTLRPAAEDHAAQITADPAGGFFRRVIRSEIALRNFNI